MLRYPSGMTALSGITLDLKRGGFYYLTGESGAGKSSLLKMFYGAVRPSSGQLIIQGVDMRKASQSQIRGIRRHTGVIFQDHKLLARRTVFENVALPLRVQGWKSNRLTGRIRKVLSFVGLESRMWTCPEALSGGEQQRVAIARAMSANPPLILADEPTGNLDIETARRVLDYLALLNRQGTTVVFATHDLHLTRSHPAPVIRLHGGLLADDDMALK